MVFERRQGRAVRGPGLKRHHPGFFNQPAAEVDAAQDDSPASGIDNLRALRVQSGGRGGRCQRQGEKGQPGQKAGKGELHRPIIERSGRGVKTPARTGQSKRLFTRAANGSSEGLNPLAGGRGRPEPVAEGVCQHGDGGIGGGRQCAAGEGDFVRADGQQNAFGGRRQVGESLRQRQRRGGAFAASLAGGACAPACPVLPSRNRVSGSVGRHLVQRIVSTTKNGGKRVRPPPQFWGSRSG